MSRALYAGTFDPPHWGHLDLIRRACRIASEVVVAVGVNRSKAAVFDQEERVELLRRCVEDLPVRVVPFAGLVVEALLAEKADFLVRGIRTGADFSSEIPMATMNRALEGTAETIFLLPTPDLAHISSSLVKEVASFGRDVKPFLPGAIADDVAARLGGP